MKKWLMNMWAMLLLVLISSLVALLPVRTVAAASTLLSARVMQAAHDRVAAGEYPMLVIGVVDGKKSRLYAFNAAGDKAADGNTMFEIGSVTKTFTALLLAEAVRSGAVTLDEPIAKLLPGFVIPSRDGKFITLGNLADQHSGLPRLPGNLKPANPADPYSDYDAQDLKAFLGNYTLPRDPGSAYEYSNLGFGLLGYALAERAHMSYGDLVQKNILEPLQMRMSGVKISDAMREHLAVGHDGAGAAVANWNFEALAGAGAIKSTGADMLRYLKANMGVLKTPLYSAMQFAQKSRVVLGGDARIGLAWMMLHTADGDVIWHNGMTGGYASFIGFSADGKHGVVVLTNIQQSVDDLGLASLVKGAALAPVRTTISMDPAALDAYVGYYQLAPHFLLVVFRSGNQLYTQATGQGALPIYPRAQDEFFAKIANIGISFTHGKNGEVDGLMLHQHGDTPAAKVDAATAAAAIGKTIAPLDAATLGDYVGHYQLTPDSVFNVTLKGGQLYAQLTGQGALPIYPSAKDQFFFIVVKAGINFERDKQGKVTALVLHQNGADQRAPRITP
ncbi:MAG: serine hydrolase [Gammaproteobacteria bacterium]